MGFKSQNLGLRGQNDRTPTRIQVVLVDLDHFAWFWAILLGFGPYSLDLGPQKRSPDGAGGVVLTDGRAEGRTDRQTDGRTDGETESPCVLQDFVPFGAAAQK